MTFNEWFDKEYPVTVFGTRPNYQRTSVPELMEAAWQAARATAEQSEPVAWMRTYRQFSEHPIEPDPGYLVTSFHQNADYAAKLPAENVPLYAAPQSSHNRDSVELEALRELQRTVEHQIAHGNGILAIDATLERLRALKSQQDAAIPFRPHHEILDALKTDPKLLADIEQAVAASKQSIAQLDRERTVTREQLNTPLCQAAGDYDVEALMDRWGIPSHLRDRFRGPMRKLVVCKQQDAAIESKQAEQSAFSGVDSAYQDWHRENYFGRIAAPKYVEIWRAACSWQAERQNSVIQSLRNALALMMDVGFQHLPANERARRYDIADAAIEAQRSGDGS